MASSDELLFLYPRKWRAFLEGRVAANPKANPEPEQAIESDKVVKKRGRKSYWADQQALAAIGVLTPVEEGGTATPLVTKGDTHSLVHSADDHATSNDDIDPIFDELVIAPVAPRPWERTTDWLKVTLFNRAIAEQGIPVAISANLGLDFLAKAHASKSFLQFVRRAVKRRLDQELGRPVEFWFAIDTTHAGRPHLHGAVAALSTDEFARIRTALQKAAGAWKGVGRHQQVDVRLETDENRWVRYATRALSRTRKIVPGRLITVTNATHRRARAFLRAGACLTEKEHNKNTPLWWIAVDRG